MRYYLLLGLVSGCGLVAPLPEPAGETGSPGAPAPTAAPPARAWEAASGFVVHESGTYTSVQDRLGTNREGLQYVEGKLPDFVRGRDDTSRHLMALETPNGIHGVTQRLQMPVLYFYGAPESSVAIDVAFLEGILSQWFPDATSYAPPLSRWSTLGGGTMRWTVELDRDPSGFPSVQPDNVWAAARDVASLSVKDPNGDREKFLFYRGVGAFADPLVVRGQKTPGGDRLELTKTWADGDITAAFLVHVGPVAGANGNAQALGGAIVPLGPFVDGRVREVAVPDLTTEGLELSAFATRAKEILRDTLGASALYEDEARAMAEAWTSSYFQTPGTRVLFLAPRSFTYAKLPLSVTPTPARVVRTWVGRIEVLTPTEEERIVQTIDTLQQRAADNAEIERQLVAPLGSFTDAKLDRVCERMWQEEIRFAKFCYWAREVGRQAHERLR